MISKILYNQQQKASLKYENFNRATSKISCTKTELVGIPKLA